MPGDRFGSDVRRMGRPRVVRRGGGSFPLRRGIMIGLFLVLGSTALLSDPTERLPLPENPLAGAKIFVDKGCFRCHAVMGFGEAFGRDLTRIGQGMNFYELAGALWSHSPRMIEVMNEKNVPRPVLTAGELRDLFSYIYYLGFFEEQGDPRLGEVLYAQKHCGQCHSLGGGGKISLDTYGKHFSPVHIAAALWNHSSAIGRSMRGIIFNAGEMAHLLAYIREEAQNVDRGFVYLQPGNAAKGMEVFRQKNCSVCHGPRGEHLRQSPLRKGLTDIVGMMWNHTSEMWAGIRDKGMSVPRFTPQEMADLLSFLYFIPFDGPEPDLEQGKEVMAAKGCLSCHSQGAVTKGMGIDLKEVSGLSVFELLADLWGHVPQMEKAMTELSLAWPRFQNDEMKNLIFYIKSLR